MGHDISGFNKAGKEIAYARFSMGNYNAHILYSLLDADQYNGGVSGIGDAAAFSVKQMEKALDAYNQLFGKRDSPSGNNNLPWDQKQILNFILNCLATAKKEEKVRVCFC
ncbi:hypothetical protein AB3U99_24265 [Niallia sp. JL1B1071]|uniref:hypothetical protein n=1 Tax=Niallia tiangongensis TaxID=3237105 RepID=UPI0037DC0BFA